MPCLAGIRGQRNFPLRIYLTCNKLSAAARLALRSETGTLAAKQRSIKAQPLFAGRRERPIPLLGVFLYRVLVLGDPRGG
jgi:hypothetical protein